MTTKIISTTYSSGYSINDPTDIITVTGDGAVHGEGIALGAVTSPTLSLINSGTITSLGTNFSGGGAAANFTYWAYGVLSEITNNAGGLISNIGTTTHAAAIYINNIGGNKIVNDGIINGQVVLIGPTSTVTNTGIMSGGKYAAIYGENPFLSINNSGTISGGTSYGAVGANTAFIANSGKIDGDAFGISLGNGGTVVNTGSIVTGSIGYDITMSSGGSVTNALGGVMSGTGGGINIQGALGTVSNAGRMMNVFLGYGGSLTNASTGTIAPTNSTEGVAVGGPGTVVNAGIISSPNSSGVDLGSGGLLTNTGTISGFRFSALISDPAGGTINIGGVFEEPIGLACSGTYSDVLIDNFGTSNTLDLTERPHTSGDVVAYNFGTITLSNAGGTILAEVPVSLVGITNLTALSDGASGTNIVGYGDVVLQPAQCCSVG